MSAPRHKQLTRALREELTSGQFKVGDRLPPEVEFAAQRGVSRTTLRRALSELEAEGLVARRKRVGTVVTSLTPQLHFLMRTNSLAELMRLERETVLDIWTTRMVEESEELLLQGKESADDRWLEVIGVRRMSGRLRAFCWNRMFVPGRYAGIEPSLARHRLASVSGLVAEIYDRPVVRVAQNVSAIACPPPAADAIGISALSPALLIESEVFSRDDELILMAQMIHDPARLQLRNEAILD